MGVYIYMFITYVLSRFSINAHRIISKQGQKKIHIKVIKNLIRLIEKNLKKFT